MTSSIYVHIPFCLRKCYYCTFSSYPALELREKYLEGLLAEIEGRYLGEKIKTLYIGGGTPSLIDFVQIGKIVSKFDFENNAEITIEANPESTSRDWLKGVFDVGVNRLSFGVQSFDDHLLKLIGRKHTVKQAFDAISMAREVGFKNINIDLIYGLPSQIMSDVSASVITACEIGVEHISSYGLKIEEGSKFFAECPKTLPDEDMQADMYLKLCEITAKYGYKHYEISNFAKKGFESRHNLNYWNDENYYGFGCGASGYEGSTRYTHENTIKKYLDNPMNLTEREILTKDVMLEESIFLGFRKADGVNVSAINEKFGIDFEKKYFEVLKKYEKYFKKTENGYALTNEGFLLSNCILSDFAE